MGTSLQTTELHRQFGLKIQELRKQHGMTQEDLAYKVGIDRSYMGFLERGEKNATLDKIIKIAKAFNIKVKDLFDF